MLTLFLDSIETKVGKLPVSIDATKMPRLKVDKLQLPNYWLASDKN